MVIFYNLQSLTDFQRHEPSRIKQEHGRWCKDKTAAVLAIRQAISVESVMLTGMPSELLCRIDNRPQDGFDADEHRGASPDIWPAQRLKP